MNCLYVSKVQTGQLSAFFCGKVRLLRPSANGFEKGRVLSWSDSVPQGPPSLGILSKLHTHVKHHCLNHNREIIEFNMTVKYFI